MLQAGDEIGRTQLGNNNAYCQDNEISWVDWQIEGPCQRLLDFTRLMIRLRAEHPALRRSVFFKRGRQIRGTDVKDLTWLLPSGREMGDKDWSNAETRAFALRLAGDAIGEVDDHGRPIRDDILLILLNSSWETVSFVLPAQPAKGKWKTLVDTRDPLPPAYARGVKAGGRYRLEGRSLAVLCWPRDGQEDPNPPFRAPHTDSSEGG